MYYTSAEQSSMDRDARNMKAAGVPLSGELEALRELVTSGNLGITSNAWDVDSLAWGGGAFSVNADLTTGLTFAYYGGRICTLNAILTVAAGTLTLSPSTTNYVQVSPAGVVSSNTAGFTAGYVPLYIIVTGVSTISTITNAKALLTSLPNGGVTGAMLSVAASTQNVQRHVSSITTTTTIPLLIAPGQPVTLNKLMIAATAAVAANNINYWTFSVTETGPAGTGATAMLAATAANTTQATGGFSLTADVIQQLALNATSGNLVTAAYDVIVFTATATGSPPALTNLAIRAEFANSN
jgi:hypothetical protein